MTYLQLKKRAERLPILARVCDLSDQKCCSVRHSGYGCSIAAETEVRRCVKVERSRRCGVRALLRTYFVPDFKSRLVWRHCSSEISGRGRADARRVGVLLSMPACSKLRRGLFGELGSRTHSIIPEYFNKQQFLSNASQSKAPVVHSWKSIKHEVIAVCGQEPRPPFGIVRVCISVDDEISNCIQIGP
jgi:hypothetical protein